MAQQIPAGEHWRAWLSARQEPAFWQSLGLALLVHAVLVTMVAVGFRFTSPTPMPVIRAVAVEDPALRREQSEQRRRAEEERARQERERAAEAERQRQLELKKKQELELKKKEDEQKRRQAEIDKKRRAAEDKKHAAEAERKRQQDVEKSLKEQLAAEERSRADAAREAKAQAAADKYKALIRQRVERNWSRPLGVPRGLQCIVRVRVVPGGEVIAATVTRGSGNALFDSSVQAAVLKASPLPLPEDPSLVDYFREIEFLFRPEEK
jgi:colicin import membrane protein